MGFHRDDFIVDYDARTVTCPAGHTVPITPKSNAIFGVRCRGCPLRSPLHDTPSKARTLHLHPHDDELVESRRAWRDGDFAEDYRRWRPMVERSIAWLVADNHRRVSFRGVERNQLGSLARASPPSTSDDWSTSDSTTTEGWTAQSRLSPVAQAQAVKKGPLFGHCPPGWPTSTLFVSALRSDMS